LGVRRAPAALPEPPEPRRASARAVDARCAVTLPELPSRALAAPLPARRALSPSADLGWLFSDL